MKKLLGWFAVILIASSILKLSGTSLAAPIDWVFLQIEQCMVSLGIMPSPDALVFPGVKTLVLLTPIILLFSVINLIVFSIHNRRGKVESTKEIGVEIR